MLIALLLVILVLTATYYVNYKKNLPLVMGPSICSYDGHIVPCVIKPPERI